MNHKRNTLKAGVALVAAFAVTQAAFGQGVAWPNKPIRFVVPFPAGGPSDAHARYIAAGMRSVLGQPVVVENVGGAAGSIGMAQVARAPADGYTIGLAHTGTHAINPHLQPRTGYDALQDFAPVARVTEYNSVLLINAKRPYKTLQQLLDAAKASPGIINYGSAGPGSTNHLATELLGREAHVKFSHIPYKGYAPARTDLLAGTIDFMFDVWSKTAADFIASGKLRALATTARSRMPSRPDIPTVAETVPNFSASGWTGVVAPAGTPPEIIRHLTEAIAQTLRQPDAQTQFQNFGYDVAYASPDQLTSIIKKDYTDWGSLIKSTGLKAD